LTVYAEVKSIRTVAPEPSRFEVPAGYIKK